VQWFAGFEVVTFGELGKSFPESLNYGVDIRSGNKSNTGVVAGFGELEGSDGPLGQADSNGLIFWFGYQTCTSYAPFVVDDHQGRLTLT